MKLAIVDDEAAERAALRAVIREYDAMHRLDMVTEEFSGGEGLLAAFHPYAFSVIFLDIYMDGLSGIETARKIREQDDETALVFLTTSEEHRPDAFSVFATDYLVKPCSRDAVFRVLDHLLRLHTKQEKQLLFTADRREYRLSLSDIASLEADGNYLLITTVKGTQYRARMPLREAEALLDNRFLRIIKGVTVNMDYVLQMNDTSCTMCTGMVLPMRSRNGKEIRQQWLNYKFVKIRQKQGTDLRL